MCIRDSHRSLAFEELVHIEVGLCVNGVSQKLGDKATFHFLAVDQDEMCIRDRFKDVGQLLLNGIIAKLQKQGVESGPCQDEI